MNPQTRIDEWAAKIDCALQAVSEDDAKARRRARRDAFIAIARGIPDPEEYAFYLPAAFTEAMLGAWLGRGCWRVTDDMAVLMRPHGLVGYGGPFLTAFGLAVRRAVVAEHGA